MSVNISPWSLNVPLFFFNTLRMLHYSRLHSIVSGGGVENSVKILKGVPRQPFLKAFGITFRNHHFDKACGHRINMKICTVFLQIGNLECPSVPKSLIPFLEKKINGNINESIFSYQ